MDPGERPEQALIRELEEELGIKVWYTRSVLVCQLVDLVSPHGMRLENSCALHDVSKSF